MNRPVATVFGWAGAEPGSAMYAEGVTLGRALVAAGYVVRCGGYFGLMEAVARGARDAGGECTGICLDTFVGKPSNEFVSHVERAPDLFDRLRSLVLGADLVVAQHGSLGTIAEVAVTWCLRYLGHPEVGPLHLVGEGWTKYRAALSSLEVAPVDADRVVLHPHVGAFAAAVLAAPDAGDGGADLAGSDVVSFEDAVSRLDASLAREGRIGEGLLATLGAKDPAEFGVLVAGGLELQQRPEEAAPLLDLLVQQHGTKGTVRYLEVGLGHGATTILVARLFMARGTRVQLTGVDDLSYERDGWLSGQRDRLGWCARELPFRLVEGSLRDGEVRRRVGDQSYDIVFVDADHSYWGCLFDVMATVGSLTPDGTLVLHDIADPESPGVAQVLALLEPHFATVDRFVGGGRCGVAALRHPDPGLDLLDLAAAAW